MTQQQETSGIEMDPMPALDIPPSFSVGLKWYTPQGDKMIAHMARVSNSSASPDDPGERLIAYLLRNHHWSPFEMANMCLEIETQRDISAQILRYRSFSFQEFSTRYAAVEQLLYSTECRFQDENNRQSSFTADEQKNLGYREDQNYFVDETVSYFDAVWNETRVRSMEAYEELLRRGVAKEVARRILPIGGIMTRLYMNGSVRRWLHYCAERTKPGVQFEHRILAIHALNILFRCFPMVFKGAQEAGLFQMSDNDRAYFEALEPFGVSAQTGAVYNQDGEMVMQAE